MGTLEILFIIIIRWQLVTFRSGSTSRWALSWGRVSAPPSPLGWLPWMHSDPSLCPTQCRQVGNWYRNAVVCGFWGMVELQLLLTSWWWKWWWWWWWWCHWLVDDDDTVAAPDDDADGFGDDDNNADNVYCKLLQQWWWWCCSLWW